MISPIVVCCLRILNCFFRSSLPQENPPSEWRKKSWWAVHKHHGCYVNTHVNMYINPCHPMCTHQAAIRANIKGGNLQQSQAEPTSAFRVSFVFLAVVSASALIIDVSACVRQAAMVRPREVCRATGWGQTGSHLLWKTGSSQTGHRRAERRKERLAESTATVHWPLFCMVQYYVKVRFHNIGSNFCKKIIKWDGLSACHILILRKNMNCCLSDFFYFF